MTQSGHQIFRSDRATGKARVYPPIAGKTALQDCDDAASLLDEGLKLRTAGRICKCFTQSRPRGVHVDPILVLGIRSERFRASKVVLDEQPQKLRKRIWIVSSNPFVFAGVERIFVISD